MKPFAKLFSEYVSRVGVSDTELARVVGVRRQTIFRWREGLTRSPRHREDVLILAQKLRLTPEETDKLLLAAGFPPESTGGHLDSSPPADIVGEARPKTDVQKWSATSETSLPHSDEKPSPDLSKSPRPWWRQGSKLVGGVLLIVVVVSAIILITNLGQTTEIASPQSAVLPTLDQGKAVREAPIELMVSTQPSPIESPTFERILLNGQTPGIMPSPPAISDASPTPTFDRALIGGATPVGADIIPAESGETLVVVTYFANYAADQVAYNVAEQLVEALELEIEEARLEKMRVAIWPETIGLRRYALQAGQAVSATLIIYGEYDLERVAVQFAHPAAERDFVKAGLLYKVSDVQALSAVINTDLPQQVRPLALLALGQIYLSQNKIEQAIRVLEQMRQNLKIEAVGDQTWSTLNFYLGMAYDHDQHTYYALIKTSLLRLLLL